MERIVAAGTSMSTPSARGRVPVSELREKVETRRGRGRTAVVLELQVPDLVDEERLERGVEEGRRLEPLQVPRQLVLVDEEAGEQEAAGEVRAPVSSSSSSGARTMKMCARRT